MRIYHVKSVKEASSIGTHNGTHDIGFIAEDLGKIVPEIVEYETNLSNPENWYVNLNGTKVLYATGIDYGKLTPMLVQAIKGQHEIVLNNSLGISELNLTISNGLLDIEKLKEENVNLQKQLEDLKAEIEGIRNQFVSNQAVSNPSSPPARPGKTGNGNGETNSETAQSQGDVSKQTMMKKFWNALK